METGHQAEYRVRFRNTFDCSRLTKSHWIFICMISNSFWLMNELHLLITPHLLIHGTASRKRSSTRDAIPTSFTVRPNRTYSYYQGGTYLELFHSFVPFSNGYQVVYNRRTNTGGTTKRGSTYLETVHVSSNFEHTSQDKRVISEKGQSDPRAFAWNGSVWCLTWKTNWRGKRGNGRIDR